MHAPVVEVFVLNLVVVLIPRDAIIVFARWAISSLIWLCNGVVDGAIWLFSMVCIVHAVSASARRRVPH
jgi:hypothetical protein